MLMGILGNLGDYKTTLAATFAREAVMSGFPVYSNYKIAWRGCHHLDISQLLMFDKMSGMVQFDEVYTLLESRISSSKLNRFISYFIFQSRKLGKDIVWTAQLDSSVDKRMFLLTPQKYAGLGYYPEDGYCDFEVMFDNEITPFSIEREWFKNNVFDYFNTWETVEPMGLDDLIIEVNKYNYEVINDYIDKYCDKILEAYGWDNTNFPAKLNKNHVEDIMKKMGLCSSLSSDVWSRLTNPHKPLKERSKQSYDSLRR